MKFKYKKYGPGILRPVIPVEIIYGDQSIMYEVLVDSGADFCIFNSGIGELLGIDIESGKKESVGGITGNEQYFYIHPVTIKIGGWEYKICAGFLQKMPNFGYGVVGQKGFFDLFTVKFDLLKEEIELKCRVN